MTKHNKEIFNREDERIRVVSALNTAISSVLKRYAPIPINATAEVGCGSGFFYRHLLPLELRGRYIGIDNHGPSLNLFRQLAPEVQVRQAEATALPFIDASLDAIFGLSAYPIFYKNPAVRDEARRVLRPGGRLIIFQDSGMGAQNLINPNNSSPGENDETENVHMDLLASIPRNGFSLVSGNNSVKATVGVSYSAMAGNLSEEESARLADRVRRGFVLVGYTRIQGQGTFVSAPISDTKKALRAKEQQLQLPYGTFYDLKIKPGVTIFQHLEMRYLVAEKSLF